MPTKPPAPSIILVTPVWNDASRIRTFAPSLAHALAQSKLPVRWIIADDGSSSSEVSNLKKLLPEIRAIFPTTELALADSHLGKGGAIRFAWAPFTHAEFLCFLDADGSVTATDFIQLLHTAIDKQSSVLGIRHHSPTTPVSVSRWRSLAHQSFISLVHALLDIDSQDPQCGAKIILGEDYLKILPHLVENGLAFDSELLAWLQHSHASWIEIPVPWTEKKGSKVHPLRDGLRLLMAVIQIRMRLSAIPPTSPS